MLQNITVVKANLYSEQIANVIEWGCTECKKNQKEYTYNIEDRYKLQCKRCGSTFTRKI